MQAPTYLIIKDLLIYTMYYMSKLFCGLTSHIVNCKYFVSKIFHAINFRVKKLSDRQPHAALDLTIRIIFHVFNFHFAHAIRKYFSNENFMIYGTDHAVFLCRVA